RKSAFVSEFSLSLKSGFCTKIWRSSRNPPYTPDVTSNAMTDHKVENIDSEDAGDLLVKIEKSFDIKFGDTELMHIKTLGELCDHVINKIQLDNSDDCTTQQAFYKLRDAITTLFCVDNKAITTEVPLDNFLPRQKR